MAKSSPEVRTYGNWKRPTSPGILGLGIIGTIILLAHLLISVVFAMVSVVNAVIWFVIGGVALYVVVRKDKHNMSILYRAIMRFSFVRQQSAHRGIYRSGPLSHIPEGHYRLPGIAANTTLAKYFDPQGREVGVLFHGNTHLTIIAASEPEGAELVDQEQIDYQVSSYGSFLNNLNNEPGLCSVSVTVETEPENGLKLQNEVLEHQSQTAPTFAKNTMADIVGTYAAGSSSIVVYTAFTYSLKALNTRDQGMDDVLHEIVARLPLMTSALEASGAGVTRTMTAHSIYKMTRVAYDPASKDLFDIADNSDEEPLVDFTNVGPSLAVNNWDSYIHDSGVSRTYVMSQAPRSVVPDRVLLMLLQPHKQLKRKRVTMIYKPISYEESADLVEQDLTNASFTANSEKRATARQQINVQKAAQAAAEEAQGASLIKFGMVVTITLDSSEELSSADAVLNNLAANARIVLRNAYGTQDSAFIAGLPLGITLDKFYSSFDSIKDIL